MSKKKKVVIASNSSLSFTGFGKTMRTLMIYLAKTGKYDLVEYAIGGNYLFEGDPRLESLPWKAYGALPNDENYLNSIQGNELKQKETAYGNVMIDELIKREKPDNFILIEDPWAIPNFFQKKWWDKINCLPFFTVDSLPILPLIVEQARNSKEYAVWVSFAKREIEKILPDKDIKVLFGAIPQDHYFPIPEEARTQYRKNFNIQEDEFVVFMNSRNQLRKYFYSNMEAVAKLKKKNPKAKIKLFFNTHFSEGWPLPHQILQYGLKQEDLLCSYVCEVCSSFYVMHFHGDNIKCPFCNSDKSFHTPNTNKGVTEEELNICYNISDCYSFPVSSGGFELTMLEACLAGLPCATINYSFGEDFCENPDIFTFDTLFYKDIFSNFDKACVNTDSVAEFIESQYNKSRKERKDLGAKIREWARSKFDCVKTCKQIEDWIDNSPEHSFDFKFDKEKPNIDYPLREDIASNEEFIEDLYVNILKRKSDPQGKENWMKALQQGASREEIHDFFIDTAKKDIKESEKSDIKTYIIGTKKKKLAYVVTGNSNEVYQSLSILESLKQKYPPQEWDYYLVTDPDKFSMFSHLTFITNVIPYARDFDNFKFTEGAGPHEGFFDVCLNPYITTQVIPTYTHNGY